MEDIAREAATPSWIARRNEYNMTLMEKKFSRSLTLRGVLGRVAAGYVTVRGNLLACVLCRTVTNRLGTN
jgi:hypothetical protein